MKMKYLTLLLMVAVLASSVFAGASSISVNIGWLPENGWHYHDQMRMSPLSVGGYAVVDNWNDIWQPTNTTIVSNLLNSDGNATTAEISFNNDYSYGTWYNNVNSAPGAVHELNKNAVRIAASNVGHNSGNPEQEIFRITGIPYNEYTAIVYLFNDGGGRTAKVTVGGTSYYYTSETGIDLEQNFFDGVYPWKIATGTTPGDYSQVANIAIFPGLTDPNVVVTFDAVSANGGISGIQIVERDPADWPAPYRGEDLVPYKNTELTLSWEAPVTFAPSGYDVYLDPNETWVAAGDASVRVAQGQPGTTLIPAADLLPDMPYYWRVDAIDPNGGGPVTVQGYVLDFVTKPAIPLIQDQPDSQTSDTLVTFEISGLNFETFQWYHSEDASTATPGNDTEVGLSQATLDVTPSLATEGWYYCVVTKAGAGSDTSEVARLMTRRLVGWWKLNGGLTDSVNDDPDVTGAPTHDGTTTNVDPNFVAGKKDQAVSLVVSQDPNDVIIITDSGDYFDFYPQGWTMSAWVNTNDDGYGAYVTKQDRVGGSKGVLLSHFNNNASFTARQTAGISNDVVNIRDGDWHLVTGTLDPESGKAKLYVDGKRYEGDEVDWNPAAMTLHDEPLFFGAEDTDGSVPFDGLLDDVRVYSYAISAVDAALLYTNFNPGSTVCIEDIAIEAGDLDGDCDVDLTDLQMFVADWLNCQIVPTCLP